MSTTRAPRERRVTDPVDPGTGKPPHHASSRATLGNVDTKTRDPRVPDLEARAGSRRSRRACARTAAARAASPVFAARRSRSSPASASTTTPVSNAATPPASPNSVLEALSRALQLDDTEHAHLFDLARAAQTSPQRRRRRTQQRIRPTVQHMLDAMYRRCRRSSATAGSTSSARTGSSARCIRSTSTARAQPSNTARFVFLDSRSTTFYADWDPVADRRGRRPARGSRPRSVRPRALGPRRRAVDAQRALPDALGHPQRAQPRHRV